MNWPTRRYLSSSADSAFVILPAFFFFSSADARVSVLVKPQIEDRAGDLRTETGFVGDDDLVQNVGFRDDGGFWHMSRLYLQSDDRRR